MFGTLDFALRDPAGYASYGVTGVVVEPYGLSILFAPEVEEEERWRGAGER